MGSYKGGPASRRQLCKEWLRTATDTIPGVAGSDVGEGDISAARYALTAQSPEEIRAAVVVTPWPPPSATSPGWEEARRSDWRRREAPRASAASPQLQEARQLTRLLNEKLGHASAVLRFSK